ncbi:MAG: hypothetical protein LBU89_10515 [Fibromonadaceae bacterium]|nr:hypothetical protein [Fibromonadaceae bacterium]
MKKRLKIIAVIVPLLLVALWFIFSGKSIIVAPVPFGLQKTKIAIGEKAVFPSAPASAEVDLQRANDLRIAGALDAAQGHYETILLKYPNLQAALFGSAYSIIAEEFVSPEDINRTKNLIEHLAQQMPGSVWVRLLVTFTREREGSLNQALDMAADLAAKSPAFAEARLRHADLILKTEQPAKAAAEARAAVSISKGADARAYVILALALHKMGSLEECSELVNYALPRFPSQTKLLLLNGYLSEYSGDFEKAQNSYRRILALKPGDINAQNAIATLGEKTPPTASTPASSGSLMILREQAKEAEKILLPLIKEYPENLPLRESLGRTYLKARMMKEARQQFSEIYAQDFDYPNIKRLLEESVEEQIKVVPQPQNTKQLTDSLARTYATLRGNENIDYDELGRYLVHYEATFKDFFSRYSANRFKQLDDETFSETYNIGSFTYDNTIFFDSSKRFYAVRVIVTDTLKSDSPGYIQDLFRHFLKKGTGTLGESIAVDTTACHGATWEGVVWAAKDNFEVLLQNFQTPRKIFIIRLNANRFPDTGNLCSYVSMALDRSRVPRR